MGLSPAERQRRSRAHRKGDHSLCDSERCVDVTPAVTAPVEPAVTDVVTGEVLGELGRRGRRLYAEVLAEHKDLGPRERVVLEEAARAADRCDRLDRILRGDETAWARIDVAGHLRELVVDKTLGEARQQQAALARLLGELRQHLAPAKEAPAPAQPQQPQSGGGKLADLTRRIAERRAQTAG